MGSGTTQGSTTLLQEERRMPFTSSSFSSAATTQSFEYDPHTFRNPYVHELSDLKPGKPSLGDRTLGDDGSVEEDHDHKWPVVRTQWNPPFTRRWVLMAFTVLFAAIVGSLQAILSVSQAHQGLANSDDGKRYLWTYGPTAILVLVTVCWRQVDYADLCPVLVEAVGRPREVEYECDLYTDEAYDDGEFTEFDSTQNQMKTLTVPHVKYIIPWAEMAKGPTSVDKSLLLDYITPIQIVALWRSIKNRHFAVSSTIVVFFLIKVLTIVSTSLLTLQAVIFQGIGQQITIDNIFDAANFAQAAGVDSKPVYTVYGHQSFGLNYTSGATDQYTSQNFAPTSDLSSATLTYSAEVDVFSAGMDCEVGVINYTTSYDTHKENTPVSSYYNTSITLSDCQIYGASLDAPDWYFLTNDTTPRFGYYGSAQNVTCDNLSTDDAKRERYMIASAYSRGISQNNNTMLNSSNIVCVPTYEIRRANVELDTNGSVLSIRLNNGSRQLEGLSGIDMARSVFGSADDAVLSLNIATANSKVDTFFTLMIDGTENFRWDMLLDSQYLQNRTDRLYGAIAAQIAESKLLIPFPTTFTGQNVPGTTSQTQNRLVVREQPARIMQGVSAAMFLITMLLIVLVPRGVLPRAIDSIAGIAMILNRSPFLVSLLRDTGHLGLHHLRTLLREFRYRTVQGEKSGQPIFSIQVITGPDSKMIDQQKAEVKWTRPYPLKRIAIMATIVVAIIAIIVLEVLLRVSNARSGLADVNEESFERYGWLYIPTIIFVLLGTIFNVMDFELEFLNNLHELARGYGDTKTSIFWDPLGDLSILTTWKSLRHSNFALSASSLSVVFAPLLTIIVSGLYSAQPVPRTASLDGTVQDWFNMTPPQTFSATTFALPGLVVEGNLSYPAWTYDELAIPQISFSSPVGPSDANRTGNVTTIMPAIRANFDCTLVPETLVLNLSSQYSGYLSVNISMPDGCGNSGYRDWGFLWLTDSVAVPETGYFGSSLSIPTPTKTCNPTMAIFYGHVTNNRTIDSFSAHLCTPSLERVSANITFDLPDLTVNTPPIVQEDSVASFSNYYSFPPTMQKLNLSHSDEAFDDTFNAIVYGKDGIPAVELLNNTRLVNGYTHVYREYMAQVVNTALRSSFATLNATQSYVPSTSTPFSATAIDGAATRLFQSTLSTRLLQSVLAVLAVCAIIVFIYVDMRYVLPKSVGSIAAVASLLAGSRVTDETSGLVEPGMEWWSDDEIERRGVWATERWRMGWWDQDGEEIKSPIGEKEGTSEEEQAFSTGVHVDEAAAAAAKKRFFRIDSRPKMDLEDVR